MASRKRQEAPGLGGETGSVHGRGAGPSTSGNPPRFSPAPYSALWLPHRQVRSWAPPINRLKLPDSPPARSSRTPRPAPSIPHPYPAAIRPSRGCGTEHYALARAGADRVDSAPHRPGGAVEGGTCRARAGMAVRYVAGDDAASLSEAQRIYQQGEGRRGLATARVIEMVAREGRAPVGEHAQQAPIGEVGLRLIFEHVG
jgi:hypothetical protein